MQEHQQRVVTERAQLDERIVKLRAFFDTETFANLDVHERERMLRQYRHMTAYSDVLGERIAAFRNTLKDGSGFQKVRLLTVDGGYVHSETIPKFSPIPDTLIWGIRNFKYESTDSDGTDVYVEAFTFVLTGVFSG